jgi:hypothetical protein
VSNVGPTPCGRGKTDVRLRPRSRGRRDQRRLLSLDAAVSAAQSASASRTTYREAGSTAASAAGGADVGVRRSTAPLTASSVTTAPSCA